MNYLNYFVYSTKHDTLYITTHKHEQAERIYQRLLGRKATVQLKQTATRSLIKVYA